MISATCEPIWRIFAKDCLAQRRNRLIHERPSLSALSKDITAVIVLLECAEAKLFNLLPMEETMSPEDLAP
jgi:hypothetical protein